LNEIEFSYLVAKLVGKYNKDKNCQHCFKKTRTNIEDFYDYLDCDKDSLVSAEDLHKHTRSILESYSIKKGFETT